MAVNYQVVTNSPYDKCGEVQGTFENYEDALHLFYELITAFEEGAGEELAIRDTSLYNYYAEYEDGEWYSIDIITYYND